MGSREPGPPGFLRGHLPAGVAVSQRQWLPGGGGVAHAGERPRSLDQSLGAAGVRLRHGLTLESADRTLVTAARQL